MNWVKIFSALAVIIFSVTGQSAPYAYAQSQPVSDKLNGLNSAHPSLSEEDARNAIMATAQQFHDKQKQCMPQSVSIEAPSPATAGRQIFKGVISGEILNGWNVYAHYQGCGEQPVKRFTVIKLPDNSHRALFINDGRTLTTMSILRDTSFLAALQAAGLIMRSDPSCDGKDIKMLKTRVLSQSDDLGPDFYGTRITGSWQEAWQFSACGRTAEVVVHFTADGDGGAYTSVPGDEIRLIGPDE